jgi:Concanavalin A-like lectin/glucanases superfamily
MNKIVCLAVTALLLGVVDNASASLVAHWGFNETDGLTAVDTIGGVNGTLVGGAAFATTSGILGGAVQITDGYVNMGNNFPSSATFSIQAWVKIDAGDISPMTPVAKHWSTIEQGYYLSVNNVLDGYTQANLAGFRSIGGSTSPTAIGGPIINDGGWHQLLGTYDNGLTSIYVDGSLAGLGSGGYSDNSADFMIGGLFNSGGIPVNLFHGFIDEVNVYDNALSGSDVRELYNSTINPVPIPGAVWLFGSAIACLTGIGLKRKMANVT